MNDATSLFNAAELALASYSTLQDGATAIDDQIRALRLTSGAQMSLTEAIAFASRFPTVVTHFSDPATGFQVTVFKDTVGDAPGNLTVAFRGTEIPEDLPTGADIVGAGAGYDQIVAMANWWAKVSAKDQMVQQFRLASYAPEAVPEGAVVLRPNGVQSLVLEAAPWAAATGELTDTIAADPDGRVDVTGHSLGGHLAMAFSSLFAARTGRVTVFNAPGFTSSAVNQAFFAKLGGSIPTGGLIVNVAADEALVDSDPFHCIAGMNSRPGQAINIAIENQLSPDEPARFLPALNHSIVALTDSLAVYKLLADLDPALSPANYKVILNQAAMGTVASYERVVDTLESLFTINDDLLPSGNDRREDLYRAITALSANDLYKVMRGTLDIAPSAREATTLLEQVRNTTGMDQLAYRYAMTELNPFVVRDANLSGLYARFQAGGANGGELDDYDPAANLKGLTQTYLEDRAAFVERKLYITALDR